MSRAAGIPRLQAGEDVKFLMSRGVAELDGERDLVTPKQAADRLGVPSGTVRSWISRRRVPCQGISADKKFLYDYHDLAVIDRERRNRRQRAGRAGVAA